MFDDDATVCRLFEHESPHVHKLVFVDISVFIEVQSLDELQGTWLIQPGHLPRPTRSPASSSPVTCIIGVFNWSTDRKP